MFCTCKFSIYFRHPLPKVNDRSLIWNMYKVRHTHRPLQDIPRGSLDDLQYSISELDEKEKQSTQTRLIPFGGLNVSLITEFRGHEDAPER